MLSSRLCRANPRIKSTSLTDQFGLQCNVIYCPVRQKSIHNLESGYRLPLIAMTSWHLMHSWKAKLSNWCPKLSGLLGDRALSTLHQREQKRLTRGCLEIPLPHNQTAENHWRIYSSCVFARITTSPPHPFSNNLTKTPGHHHDTLVAFDKQARQVAFVQMVWSFDWGGAFESGARYHAACFNAQFQDVQCCWPSRWQGHLQAICQSIFCCLHRPRW